MTGGFALNLYLCLYRSLFFTLIVYELGDIFRLAIALSLSCLWLSLMLILNRSFILFVYLFFLGRWVDRRCWRTVLI